MGKKSSRGYAISLLMVFLINVMKVMTEEEFDNNVVEVKIGVVLDEEFESWNGRSWLSCMHLSISDFYASRGRHYKTRLILHARDSTQHVVGAAGAALDLIKNVQVEAILGPATSSQANFVIKLGEKAQVPIISFSASSPALTSIRSPYFFLATQNDKQQVNTISATFQAYGWREAVPIYADNEYGVGIIPYLIDALQAVNTRIPYHSSISPSATDDQILEELYKLMKMEIRVFIVHMLPSLGTRLFAKAEEVGMLGAGYVWILTDGMTNLLSSIDGSIFQSIHGVVLGVQPYIPKTKDIENLELRWQRKFSNENPDIVDVALDIYGLRAYDAITALAIAVEKAAGTREFGFTKSNLSSVATDLENFGVSINGFGIAQALSNITFKGLTGDFLFVNQQLQPSPFHVININGVRPWGISLWTPEKHGRKLALRANSLENYRSEVHLPRSTQTKPKTLYIAVPVKHGFKEFVNVTKLPNNKVYISGLCIQVFQYAMSKTRNAPPYKLVPYPSANSKNSANYSEVVNEVFSRKYDGAVGDISIIASRARNVDFTLPFMESGYVKMIVTTKHRDKTWDFLKPLSWQLWVTVISFFIFIGIVVWLLERESSEEFQGSLSNQFGTSFWFAFSIMVFAHRERIANNSTRVVVIVSCFVILIVTQSYTASLASYLTLQSLEPGNNDVNELIKKKAKVGYQQGSFVFELLKSWGFNQTNLVPYVSAEDCSHLLSNGTITAVFEETPYLNLILNLNCSKYEVVTPKLSTTQHQFQTVGFGFVFPTGSWLAPNLSRQIVDLIESNYLYELGKKLSIIQKECLDAQSSDSSNDRLGLESFWFLFLVAVITSLIALLMHGVKFYEPRNPNATSSGNENPATNAIVPSLQSDDSAVSVHEDSLGDQQEPSSTEQSDVPNQTPEIGDSHIELTTLRVQEIAHGNNN